MTDEQEPWYTIKAVFHHADAGKYEERIVLVKADGFDEAERKGIKEAQQYVADLDKVSLIKIIDVFHLFGNHIDDLSEVYSEMTDQQPQQGR